MLQRSTIFSLFLPSMWVVFLASPAFAGDVPPNTLCSGAGIVPVSVGTPVTVTGNNEGSSTDPVLGATLVWEGFTTTECTDMTVSYCGTTPAFLGGLAYLAVGCPLTNLVFNTGQNVIGNVCGDGNFAILFPELPPGTYYYPVLEAPGSSGNYSVTFIATACTSTPPANAFCGAPIELTSGANCTPIEGTVAHATVAGNSGTSCDGADVSDGVWYSFVATSTAHDITVTGSDMFAAEVELFGGSCPTPTPIACASANDFGLTETLSSTGLIVGQTYLIRVSDWYSGMPRSSTFEICVVGIVTSECDADASTLTADTTSACVDGTVTISATLDGELIAPEGFDTLYVLTSGQDLIIEQIDLQPSFEVSEAGTYTIHTLIFDGATLDLGTIVFGETTAADINALLIQGGGSICGSLDMTGASINVTPCCAAIAGALDPVSSFECLVGGTSPVNAVIETPSEVPSGFVLSYVLSQGPDRIIQQLGADPSFIVNGLGAYTIHTFVYDSVTVDPEEAIVFGTTTATGLHSLFVEGGGSICASLDLAGAIITVLNCCTADAGTIVAVDDTLCYPNVPVTINATPVGDAVVPNGFSAIYVLTLGEALVIQDTSLTASFQVSAPGAYTVHTLVYDPTTLDLGMIVPGETTAGSVAALLIQGGGTICGSLDVTGAVINVQDCRPVNDDCAAASEISVSLITECAENSVNGNNTFATAEMGNAPGCDETTSFYADVWYRFNSGENTVVSVVFDPGTMTDWGVAVSDACTGGSELACEINPAVPIDVTTAPDTDYWVRVYSDMGAGSGGQFTLCVSGTAPTIVCDGANVQLGDGSTNITICQDGDPDVIDVLNSSASVQAYDYVVTDESDIIVALMAMGSLDFNALPMGGYRVWGVSHNGALQGVTPGSPASGITSDGACIDLSNGFVTVSVEICNGMSEPLDGAWDLFPNPASGTVNIRYMGVTVAATIEVIDMGGRIVSSERTPLTHGQVHSVHNAAELAPGAYTVRLNDGLTVTNLRLVVQ